MKMKQGILSILLLILTAALSTQADTVRIMTIGNSFADNACRYLDDIAAAQGHTIVIEKANIGGGSLEGHWNGMEAWKIDPDSAEAKPYGEWTGSSNVARSLEYKLNMHAYDWVTIQQVSHRSYQYDTFQPYAADLVDFIHEHAPGVGLAVHQTWAYREDDSLYDTGSYPNDPGEMYAGLTDSYLRLAQVSGGVPILPSGAAFENARLSTNWNLSIDPSWDPDTAVYPELPNTIHSLHSGWEWQGGTNTVYLDSHHAGPNGEYLAGLMWYQFLFDDDATNVTWKPADVSSADAALLRQIASDTAKEKELWMQDDPMEVLFLGNSFTHLAGGTADTNGVSGIPKRFREIAVGMGEDEPIVRQFAPGGSKLYEKVDDTNVLAYLNNPARTWDYVVLQEHSLYPTDLYAISTQRFYQAVQDLKAVITNANPATEALLYMTWARQDGHALYTDEADTFDDRLHMQAQLRKHYDAAGEAAGVEVVPVGNGWDLVYARDASLGDSLYGADQYHQGPNGAYFNALVFYSRIYGREPTGLTAPNDSSPVPQADADALMPLAWQTATPAEFLFIGNSFTHRGGGLAARFQQLLEVSGDPDPVSTQVAYSGWSLKGHWTDADQDARNAINDTNRSWDAVSLQEYSTYPTERNAAKRADFFTYGSNFYNEVTSADSNTTVLLFETWARSESNTAFYSDPANAALVDRPTMQAQLRTNYNQLAQNTGATVAPCGDAWETAHHVDRSVPLYASDEYHQSDTGAYLNSLIFYSTFFGRDPRGLRPPTDIDADDAAFLQEVARSEVLGGYQVHQAPQVTLIAPTNNPAQISGTGSILTLQVALSDDDYPGVGLTSLWTQVSGPGTADFADAGSTNTTVTFDQEGTYQLRVTVDDSDLTDTLDLTVHVGAIAVASGPLATWNFQSMTGSTSITETNASFMATGMLRSATSGVLTHSDTSRMYGSVNAIKGGRADFASLADALAAGEYFKWTVEPEEGMLLSITNLFLKTDHSSLVTGAVFSSVSGFTAGDVLATMLDGNQDTSIDLSADSRFDRLDGPVEFRLYGFGTDSQYRLMQVGDSYSSSDTDDDIVISGTLFEEADGSSTNIQTDVSSVAVPEGSTNIFRVRLSAAVAQPATVTVARTAGDTDLSVSSGGTLVFATNAWDQWQTVTLAAAEDGDFTNGSATVTLSSPGLPDAAVTVTESENDFLPQIELSTNALAVAEGSTASFDVRLDRAPAAAKTVTVSRISGDSDLTVSAGGSPVFDSGNWDQWQTVTLAAAEDGDTADGSAVIQAASPQSDNVTLTATEADNDEPIVGDSLYRVLVDFNDSYVPGGNWNVTDSYNVSGQVLTDLTATNGATTDADLYIADIFSGANGSGIADSSLYPSEAQRDSFYITGFGGVGSQTQAIVQVRGLSTSNLYDITLFGSRAASEDDRTSRFVINDQTQYVHCADNTTNAAVFTGLSAPTGAITIVLSPYNESDVHQEYAYLGVLDLTAYASADGETDTDGDGLPDDWESEHFGSSTAANPTHMAANGINTVRETYIAGINPTNPASTFVISDLDPLTAEHVLQWQNVSGRVYSVYWSSNLLSGFQILQSNITGGAFTDAVHQTDPSGFYRIDVELAP